ncbi:hypothetical protein Natpe_2810 [Natrinema pellirubrum DSM 15624]|uniref:Uncharacterized protein n=1 Tax=Natrinema pellirubrum (strain DSM 15624 / CIP 106293 / JCM 10476 / NCIMB 786 / 157) TaxID=797303 RepID=L0JMW6_NATP1|nr:hypothetical protein Natpe_2810 [Natrinema pellirubrum DSM 15624]
MRLSEFIISILDIILCNLASAIITSLFARLYPELYSKKFQLVL